MTNAKRLARALEKQLDAVPEVPDSPEARARTVAAIQAAMQAEVPEERSGARRALALAAGLLVLVAGTWLIAWRAGPREQAVESGANARELTLGEGVKLRLEPGTAVEVRDDGARLLIRRGEVAAEVTTPFTVEAFDSEVSTRGARFVVKAGGGCEGRTQVEVTEGRVTVSGGVEVRAGETWPSCPPRPAPEPMKTPPSPEPIKAPVPPSVATKKPAPPPPVKELKELKEEHEARLARQNELYREAVVLQRAGDVRGAVKKLDEVLSDGQSPLAETALAQKMKWLVPVDRGGARAAAAEYLERFPMGFGRADAETLVLEPR